MGIGKFIAVPVGLLAILLFWLNEPLPPNTGNPVKYKMIAGFLKLHLAFAELESWWTGVDFRIVEQQNTAKVMLSHRMQDPDVLVSEDTFAGVHVYIYKPRIKKSNRPALIYLHGGGFRTGHATAYESMIFKFVKQLDMVVISVDYRLTPNVKAPVPHEDCEKATQHFFINAEKYGVDPKLVGVGGDSCGGNLASSLSLTLRDQGEDQFAFQLLIYPWVQGLDMQTPSYQRNCINALPIMSHEIMTSFLGSFLGLPPRVFPELLANRHVKPETWDKYKKYFNIDEIPKKSIPSNYKPVRPKEINKVLADFVEEDLTNPYLWPLLAEDLSDLPPAYVLVVENDPIRDEGIWFANRLKKAGNKVEYDYSSSGFHAMIGMQEDPLAFDEAVRATDNMIKFSRQILDDIRKNPSEMKKPKAAKIDVETNLNKKDGKGQETATKAEKSAKPAPDKSEIPKVTTTESAPKPMEQTQPEKVQKQKSDAQKSKSDPQKLQPDIPRSPPEAQISQPDPPKPKADTQKSKPDTQKSQPDTQKSKPDTKKSQSDPPKPDTENSKPDTQKSKPDTQKPQPDTKKSKSDPQKSKSDPQKAKPDAQKSQPDTQKVKKASQKPN